MSSPVGLFTVRNLRHIVVRNYKLSKSTKSFRISGIQWSRTLSTTTSTTPNNEKGRIRERRTYEPVLEQYSKLLSSGGANVEEDEHQLDTINELDRLYSELRGLSESGKLDDADVSTGSGSESSDGGGGLLGGFFSSSASKLKNMITSPSTSKIKGVYIHGDVGCGKTFCMNLFYDSLNEPEVKITKQKVHFHKFMLGVHQRMHLAKLNKVVEDDPLPVVIDQIMAEGRVICFDEFQVTDVADALILRRLFTGIFERGGLVVATSNRPPQDLYLGGLQRDLFLPFIDLLEEKTTVVDMWDSETDYRIVHGVHKARGTYFLGDPFTKGKTKADEGKNGFNELFDSLTQDQDVRSTYLSTQGRNVLVERCCMKKSVARFNFWDLCGKALGAADYLIIAETFHTIFLEDVPRLKIEEFNVVRRFITLIDALYENHCKIIFHAEDTPDRLFVTEDVEGYDEVFAFDRTRSRIEEMGSEEYLKKMRKKGKS